MGEHLYWRDIIEINTELERLLSDTTPEEYERFVERTEQLLDYVENTEMGQQLLHDINDKYLNDPDWQEDKIQIFINDKLGSEINAEGNISIDIRGSQYLAFMDQESGEPVPMSFERSVLHELFHSGSQDIPIGQDYYTSVPLNRGTWEQNAVELTDEFARLYMPELGQREIYDNSAGDIDQPQQGRRAQNGLEQLRTDPRERRRIEQAIETHRKTYRPDSDGSTEPTQEIDKPAGKKELFDQVLQDTDPSSGTTEPSTTLGPGLG